MRLAVAAIFLTLLLGCRTPNSPPPSREIERYEWVEVWFYAQSTHQHHTVLTVQYASVREALYVFKNGWPNHKVDRIETFFAVPE